MSLTREQVLHVAKLARLKLSDDEVDRFGRQLSAILEHVAALDALDTAAVEPTTHPIHVDAPMRDDVVVPSLPPELALANAPARERTAIRVPAILDNQ